MKYFIPILMLITSMSHAQDSSEKGFAEANYDKAMYEIQMRDGVKLFTIVYTPKDKSVAYPMMLKRTCYSVKPYGEDEFPTVLGPSEYMMHDKYIFVYQDVRGRWMSEGSFDNMRPHLKGNDQKNKNDIDESSDTFDTIEWLLKNIDNHNGRVGQWGISYPGFYTAAALPEAHPALVASSPQAPIADFYFDDFHHQGAFINEYLYTFPVFGVQKSNPTKTSWYSNDWTSFKAAGNIEDAYQFYMDIGLLKDIEEKYFPNNFFWKQIVEHPNYDEFWQSRNILPHLEEVNHAVMTVGGWFDAEDLYGPLHIYKTLEKNNPGIQNTIVMGPWSHGDWSREKGRQSINHIYFGDSISTFYQKEIERPFFTYHLKGQGDLDLPEALMFDTGIKEWKRFNKWPDSPKSYTLKFASDHKLVINENVDEDEVFSYESDPMHPVPVRSEIVRVGFTPRNYMTDDQRHASRRPDVLTFSTDVLETPITLSGEIKAMLKVMLSCTDADFVVKLIDVYPEDAQTPVVTPDHITMRGYQQLVRSEIFRGRFRHSFESPEPFTPGEVEEVSFPLQDILHTFKSGHRIMVQIHSTWFPLIDRNPQKYVDNIFLAEEEDFMKGTISIMGDSKIIIGQ
jgi:putative CocE/NonD family hydrolase